MNGREIERVLNANLLVFRGVYSCDTLPEGDVRGLLVSNTDPHDKPGEHWIAMYIDGERGEYFDSFGRAPNKHFESYMNKHCTIWTFNKKQLQSIISSFCGYYCCMFCMLSCRRVDMTRIVNMFTTDTGFNDCIAHSFVCNKSY